MAILSRCIDISQGQGQTTIKKQRRNKMKRNQFRKMTKKLRAMRTMLENIEILSQYTDADAARMIKAQIHGIQKLAISINQQ